MTTTSSDLPLHRLFELAEKRLAQTQAIFDIKLQSRGIHQTD